MSKPLMVVTGIDGNAFGLLGAARLTLRRAGMIAEVTEVSNRVLRAKSYNEAVQQVFAFVEPVFTDTPRTGAGQYGKPFVNLRALDGTMKTLLSVPLDALLRANLTEWYWEAIYRLTGVTDYEKALQIVFEYVEPIWGPEDDVAPIDGEPIDDEDYDDSRAY